MTARRAGWLVVLVTAMALCGDFQATGEAQDGAKYLGPKLCNACHGVAHPDVIASWSNSAHARAMWSIDAEDEKHQVVADFSQNPPFDREQIAYVLGTGRKYQSYLDKDLKVLPAEWVVKDQAWLPREPVDTAHDCLGCHTTGFDPETRKWAALGVSCEMCHGPGSAHAGASDKKASIVRPEELEPARRAMVCGQCHAHGKSKDGAYAFPAGFRPGDDLEQFFVVAPEAPEGVVNSQYNELVHGGGKHLAAGTVCTTCHDPHGSVSDLAAQVREPVNQLCLSEGCHGGKLVGAQHTEDALQVVSCTICHMPGSKHSFVAPKG